MRERTKAILMCALAVAAFFAFWIGMILLWQRLN